MLADPNVPSATIPREMIDNGMTVAEAFIEAGLASSRGDARRLAAQGGLSIDGNRVDDVDATYAGSEQPQLFRVGKKRFKRVARGA